MKMEEVDLVAQETKPLKRFMIRWHNWNCDHVSFVEEPSDLACGLPLGTFPNELLVKMYINFRRNYFSYIATWLVPDKCKCGKE